MEIHSTLESFFRDEAPLSPGDRLIVAFSGGPDSTALLLGLLGLPGSPRLGVRLVATHLNHGMDSGSGDRAEAAARLAERLGVRFVLGRREVPRLREPGAPRDSPEAAARRVRYEFLEEVRQREGARWIATAHHQDDQAETVLLRLLFGSGLEGLGGIRRVNGAVVRPLLDIPRQDLLAAVEAAGLEPVQDPTNADLDRPRNRVRHLLLPALTPSAPLACIATKTRAAMARLDLHLERHLTLQKAEDGIGVDRADLERLPPEVLPFALAWLHRRAGAPYPAGGAARTELLRQLHRSDSSGHAACDCGDGWRWETSGSLLILRRSRGRLQEDEERVEDFSYTLEIPGEVEIPEIAVRVGLSRRPVEPWMFEGSPRRAALALPLAEGDCVTVRNRRPGDRIHPLGANGSRKLKEVLIDRRVPRRVRERLPLICVGESIAWVPGVTIDQRFRIAGESTAWLAEVTEVISP